MSNDAIFFQRGTSLSQWLNSQASIRWATDAEVRAEFGISREEWIRRWQAEKPKTGGKAA